MTTSFYSHATFYRHNTGPQHPESSDRLRAIDRALEASEFAILVRKDSPLGDEKQIRLIHPQQHIDRIFGSMPDHGSNFIDGDTVVSPASGNAALHAVGAVCAAVDAVFNKQSDNAFCAVRPPGHHAEPTRAMGFCLFNNIAIAAQYARTHHAVDRAAIVDFDVHHGNGTQAAFYNQPKVLYASSHQMPLYPGSGSISETGAGNIFNAPLAPGNGSMEFRAAMENKILPALRKFRPDIILISAGFDAHKDDPLASLNLVEEDFGWITGELVKIADQHCKGRIVSALEGGYNLDALGNSVVAHLRELIGFRP